MADSSVSRFGCYTIIWDVTFSSARSSLPLRRCCLRSQPFGNACIAIRRLGCSCQ